MKDKFTLFRAPELNPYHQMVQSAGVVEYTDCISTEGRDFLNEFRGYNLKQSDDEAPCNAGALKKTEYPYIAIPLSFTLARSSITL